jgi:hypothetical protein
MVAGRSNEAATSVPVPATRAGWQCEAPLFQLAVWVLEEDGGVMSAGDAEVSLVSFRVRWGFNL